jgi:hypothetical protein
MLGSSFNSDFFSKFVTGIFVFVNITFKYLTHAKLRMRQPGHLHERIPQVPRAWRWKTSLQGGFCITSQVCKYNESLDGMENSGIEQ